MQILSANLVNLNPNGSKGQSEERKKMNVNKSNIIKVIRRKSKSPDAAADVNDNSTEQKISPPPKKVLLLKKSLSPPGG